MAWIVSVFQNRKPVARKENVFRFVKPMKLMVPVDADNAEKAIWNLLKPFAVSNRLDSAEHGVHASDAVFAVQQSRESEWVLALVSLQ